MEDTTEQVWSLGLQERGIRCSTLEKLFGILEKLFGLTVKMVSELCCATSLSKHRLPMKHARERLRQ
jgi:hypothetical protein